MTVSRLRVEASRYRHLRSQLSTDLGQEMILLGKIIAWAMVLIGSARIAVGLWVANTFIEPEAYAAATARYIGSGTTGDAIDGGIILVILGVCLGLIAHFVGSRHKFPSEG